MIYLKRERAYHSINIYPHYPNLSSHNSFIERLWNSAASAVKPSLRQLMLHYQYIPLQSPIENYFSINISFILFNQIQTINNRSNSSFRITWAPTSQSPWTTGSNGGNIHNFHFQLEPHQYVRKLMINFYYQHIIQ